MINHHKSQPFMDRKIYVLVPIGSYIQILRFGLLLFVGLMAFFCVSFSQGSSKYQFAGYQTVQMYGNFEGFPSFLVPCLSCSLFHDPSSHAKVSVSAAFLKVVAGVCPLDTTRMPVPS